MAPASAPFLFLVLGTATCQTLKDSCQGEHCSFGDNFADEEDANFFLQLSATRNDPRKAVQLDESTNTNITTAERRYEGITEQSVIKPFDCKKYRGAIQIMETPELYKDGFQAVSLDPNTGKYQEMWKIPFKRTMPQYADLNACGISPIDDKIYCVIFSGGSFIVRLDDQKIEYVAWLQWWTYNTAGFAPSGTFFVATTRGHIIVAENLAAYPGYTDLASAKAGDKLLDLRKAPRLVPPGWFRTSDLVAIRHDFREGMGEREYVISAYGPKLQIAMFDEATKTFTASWVKDIIPGRWDNIYGAAWNFQGKIYFATNRGGDGPASGVFEVPLTSIKLDSDDKITLHRIVNTERAENNDGFNCPKMASPFITDIMPFDCAKQPGAIHLMKVEWPEAKVSNFRLPAKEYIVSTYNLRSGQNTPIYRIPSNITDPPFVSLNGAGINPVDSIAYGTLKMEWWKDPSTPSPFYIVRFDENKIEFLAKVQGESDAIAGTFDLDGNFFVSSHPYLFAFSEMDRWVGFPNASHPSLPEYNTSSGLRYNHSIEPVADMVVVGGTFDGGPAASYLMAFNQFQQLILINLNTEKSWALRTTKVIAEPTGGQNFGAAWNFNGTVVFASNSGEGTFKVPLDRVDINSTSEIPLEKVGASITIHDNDGLNCMATPSPV